LALSGCGGISDHLTTHHLAIHTQRPRQPLTVSVRQTTTGTFHSEQRLTTDAHGDASAAFRSRWGSFFFIIPPIGSIPRRPEKPAYVVQFLGDRFVLSPTTPEAQYQWRDGSWFTDAFLDSRR
jgi:hypothetical protein